MSIRVGIIGTGGIARANHIPGLKMIPDVEITALCDADAAAVREVSEQTGIRTTFTDYHELLEKAPVDAVVIATPTVLHHPAAMAAIAAGKHVLCEKQLGMSFAETVEMTAAAEQAGLRNMTAFTYRFVPAMRYMKHLVDAGAIGKPYHIRVNRLQDFEHRSMGWRQVKEMAGTGELGDMLSHRLDFTHYLVGGVERLVARMKQYLGERVDTSGRVSASNVDDWVAILAEYENGATGVCESSKLCAGRGYGAHSQDYCEVNGSEGTLIYYLEHPNELQVGKPGGARLETIPVPEEFLKVPGSPRNPHEGDPLQVFRFDQNFEFIQAIREGRPCQPSFEDGMRAQALIDAVVLSDTTAGWVEVSYRPQR